jgi:hypothetical protein
VETPATLTFEQLGMRWMKHERVDRVQTARDEGYRLKQLCAMVTAESTALGQRPARSVTEDDIESAFDVLRQRGYAASTINCSRPPTRGCSG